MLCAANTLNGNGSGRSDFARRGFNYLITLTSDFRRSNFGTRPAAETSRSFRRDSPPRTPFTSTDVTRSLKHRRQVPSSPLRPSPRYPPPHEIPYFKRDKTPNSRVLHAEMFSATATLSPTTCNTCGKSQIPRLEELDDKRIYAIAPTRSLAPRCPAQVPG